MILPRITNDLKKKSDLIRIPRSRHLHTACHLKYIQYLGDYLHTMRSYLTFDIAYIVCITY